MELGGPTSAEIIRRATAATLARADALGARSLALVAFGTGVGGFPLDEAARIEVEEVAAPPRRRLGARARRLRRPRRARPRGVPGARSTRPDERPGRRARGRRRGRRARPPRPPSCARCCWPRCATAARSSGQALGLRRARSRSRSATTASGCSPPRRRAPRCAPTPSRPREREWLLVAAAVGALVELAEPGAPADAGAIGVTAGELDGFLVVALPAPRARRRRRSTSSSRSPSTSTRAGSTACAPRAYAVPGAVLADVALRAPIGAGPPAADRRGGRAARRPPRGRALGRGARGRRARAARARRGPPRRAARGSRPGPARRPPDPPAARRHGEVGRLPHRLRAPRARLRRQRPRARAGGRGGAARRRAARREAVGRPAPRVPQPAPGGRHPPADRDGRGPAGLALPTG